MEFEAVVAGIHLRYDGVRQRPHHLLARLSARVPVLFVEEPFRSESERDELVVAEPLTVLRPHRRDIAEPGIDAATLACARTWLGARRPLVWLSTPMLLGLADAFPEAPLVYDCMDDLASFAFAPAKMREHERALLERADAVFAGGRTLYERRLAYGEKVHLYPSAVEFEHFARAQTLAPPSRLQPLARPIFGYAGVIDERIDLAIVREFSRRGLTLAMLGPFAKIDPAELPRAPNVHYLGPVDYRDLPAYLAGFDVALLPFARNAATANISPTKTPEYLAAGKPVVSTPIFDVLRDYGEVVSFGATAAGFVDACEAALEPDPDRRRRGIECARALSWDATVESMLRDISRRGASARSTSHRPQ
ncbi:MAG: glycosyltransferase [Candidatus Baltobacteraceae bacterium]